MVVYSLVELRFGNIFSYLLSQFSLCAHSSQNSNREQKFLKSQGDRAQTHHQDGDEPAE
jgi:hypothetical protein